MSPSCANYVPRWTAKYRISLFSIQIIKEVRARQIQTRPNFFFHTIIGG